MQNYQERFNALLNKYSQIYLIVSPPRCSSTALARVFWEQPSICYYAHEPFEVVYYENENLDAVLHKIHNPLDLSSIKANPAASQDENSLVIKEMPYQVGSHFPLLASVVAHPIIFLIRDPRLNIRSRMEKKVQGGDSPAYPFIESGWDLLYEQIRWCRQENVPHIILDATEFRNFPKKVFSQLFARFELPFATSMLKWKPCENVKIDNLNGRHHHLYRRILRSNGLIPAVEPVPDLTAFPDKNGFRDHVRHCMKIYRRLRNDSARISPVNA